MSLADIGSFLKHLVYEKEMAVYTRTNGVGSRLQ